MLISLHIVKAMSAIFCLVSRIPQFLGTLSKVPVKEDFAFANTAAVQKKNRYQDKIPCEAHACGTCTRIHAGLCTRQCHMHINLPIL